MSTPDPAKTEPIEPFRVAVKEYQVRRNAYEIAARRESGGLSLNLHGLKADQSHALEQVWVSGMESVFNLLTTNYQAQKELVAEQLRLARKTTWATIAMAVIAGLAIVVAMLGPKFWRKDPQPAAPVVNVAAPIIYTQLPPLYLPHADWSR